MPSGNSFNFGPSITENHSVLDLVQMMGESWDKVTWEDCSSIEEKLHEAGLLKLNCDKALGMLNWKSTLPFRETIRFTVEWYKEFFESNKNILNKSSGQIDEYIFYSHKKFSRLDKMNNLDLKHKLQIIENVNGSIMHALKKK